MYSNNVNEFDTENLEWKEIGRMVIGRQHQAADFIEYTESFVQDNCIEKGMDFFTFTSI